jgi:hypothetical protein
VYLGHTETGVVKNVVVADEVVGASCYTTMDFTIGSRGLCVPL